MKFLFFVLALDTHYSRDVEHTIFFFFCSKFFVISPHLAWHFDFIFRFSSTKVNVFVCSFSLGPLMQAQKPQLSHSVHFGTSLRILWHNPAIFFVFFVSPSKFEPPFSFWMHLRFLIFLSQNWPRKRSERVASSVPRQFPGPTARWAAADCDVGRGSPRAGVGSVRVCFHFVLFPFMM